MIYNGEDLVVVTPLHGPCLETTLSYLFQSLSLLMSLLENCGTLGSRHHPESALQSPVCFQGGNISLRKSSVGPKKQQYTQGIARIHRNLKQG